VIRDAAAAGSAVGTKLREALTGRRLINGTLVAASVPVTVAAMGRALRCDWTAIALAAGGSPSSSKALRTSVSCSAVPPRRRGIAAEVAPNLVYLVQHEHRIVGLCPSNALDNLSRQSPDVCPPMPADLRFIVYATQR